MNPPAACMAAKLCERRSMHTRINGGSSDTDVKADTVSPWSRPSWVLVTTVTLAAKLDMMSRNAC